MRAAIFLDRDGTLIEDRGYLSRADQAVFYPDTIPALSRVHGQLELFVVTNQSGVGQGLITHADADRVNAHVAEVLARAGISIRATYVCPHKREDGCTCRKPQPYFLRRAEREHGVDLSRSFSIGDHPGDVELARGAGGTGILVHTGHGDQHRTEIAAEVFQAAGIGEAVEHLLVRHAARVLAAGGLVAMPTETVYGLAANAEDAAAVARIFAVKGRPADHPLIVHLGGAGALSKWARKVPREAELLAERFWPGPLTMILERGPRVLDAVSGGQDTVGLRVPAHPLARALLAELGPDAGLAAPSANKFGRVSPTEAAHVFADLGAEVDFVLDGGPCPLGIESTIVDLSGVRPVVLRPGGVSLEALEEALGREVPVRGESSAVRAPGLLPSHYAPRAEVVLTSREGLASAAESLLRSGRKVAVLSAAEVPLPAGVLALARPATVEALAQELYRALREADARGAEVVLVEAPEELGLGRAILDRLRKAGAPRVSVR